MSNIKDISIELFDPNPYQPETRIQVTDQVAEQYGKSILQHGLLQIPLVRVSPTDSKRYQMGDGWLRLTGFKWLAAGKNKGYDKIPCEVRELSDEQMAHLVFEANGVRKDLNPIETATYFQKYLTDFKVTEAKLAEIHGLSQGEVANTIRLLQLPQEVQYLVGQGQLSQTHARHLLRLNKVPETQQKMVKEVIKNNTPVSQLANEVESRLWQMSKSLNVKSDESYNRPSFDVDKECKGCEHTVEAAYPWGNRKKELRCLKPECWDKKEAAAVAVKVKEAKEELAKDFKGQKVFTNKDLPHDQHADLSDYTLKEMDNPKECKTCDKVVLYKYDMTHPGKPERVCTNPACLRAKKAKKTRDENKIRSGEDKVLTAKLAQAFVHAPSPRAAMLIYARHHIPGISAAAKEDLAVLVPGLPKVSNGRLDMDKLMVKVEDKPLDELLKLVVAAEFCQVRRQHSYEKFNTKLTAELKKDLATIEGTLEKHVEELKVWQEANCRGCTNAKEVLVGSGLECCEYSYNKKILSDGTCERGKAHKAKTDSKRASVDHVEGSETEEPTSSTPQSERGGFTKRTEKSVVAPAEFDAAKRRELAKIPPGVRLDNEVPKEECEKCLLATEDHTIDMKFKIRGVVAGGSISNGQDTYLKVCVKDWQRMVPATQGAIVEVAEKAAGQLAKRRSDGIQTITDAEGLKTVYCSKETLAKLQDMNSAGTLTEKKPRLAGLYELDGQKYACIGTVSSGKDGVLSADCYLALPFEEINKLPDGGGNYHGQKCSFHGAEYVLAGREIEFLPQPPVKSAGKITKKVTRETLAGGELPCETCDNDGETCNRERFHIDDNNKYVCEHKVPQPGETNKPKRETNQPGSETGKGKKNKEAKPHPISSKLGDELGKGIENNETKTKTVSSPSPAQEARSPLAQAKTSELAELQANGKNKEKPKRSGKKNPAGASPIKNDIPPAGAPAALSPAGLK